MRKINIVLTIAIALALFASVAFYQVSTVSAQFNQPVGIVVAYVPGQSITVVDQQGDESEFLLAPTLRILPPGRADALAVGSFVTVIAPASVSAGKQTAVGIVIHPQIPNGWTIPSLSQTPFPTTTAAVTETITPTGTLTTETPTPPPPTETPTAVETIGVTPTETPPPVVILTNTPTATPTPLGGTANSNTFIEWLRSLFRQVLGND